MNTLRVTLIFVVSLLCACESSEEAMCVSLKTNETPTISELQLWELGPLAVSSTGASCTTDDPIVSTVFFGEALSEFDFSPKGTEDLKLRLYYPDEQGPHPLILFIHGNDRRACVLFDDFTGIHKLWASWGYVVASIDARQFNCGGGGIEKENIVNRAALLKAAHRTLEELNEDPTWFLFDQIRTDDYIVAGHSRGAGAALAATTIMEPMAAFAMQPIDFSRVGWGDFQTNPDVPVVAFTASKDTDVVFPYAEPTEDRILGPYSWHSIQGGIHAFTADSLYLRPLDDPDITRKQQHQITALHTLALAGEHAPSKALSEWAASHPETSFRQINYSTQGAEFGMQITEKGTIGRWNPRVPGTILVDSFDSRATDSEIDTNALGGAITSQGLEFEQTSTYRPDDNLTSGQFGVSHALRLTGTGTYRTAIPEDITLRGEYQLAASIRAGVGWSTDSTVEVVVLADSDEAPAKLDPVDDLSETFQQLEISGIEARPLAVEIRIQSAEVFVDNLRFEPLESSDHIWEREDEETRDE